MEKQKNDPETCGFDLDPMITSFTESLEILNRIKGSRCFDVSKVLHMKKIAATNKNKDITKFKLFVESHFSNSKNRYYSSYNEINTSYIFRGGESKSFLFNKQKHTILENCDFLYYLSPEQIWNGKVIKEKEVYVNSECPNFLKLFNKLNETLKTALTDLSKSKQLSAEDMKKFPDWVKDFLILA